MKICCTLVNLGLGFELYKYLQLLSEAFISLWNGMTSFVLAIRRQIISGPSEFPVSSQIKPQAPGWIPWDADPRTGLAPREPTAV
jgi:hypothetical protein